MSRADAEIGGIRTWSASAAFWAVRLGGMWALSGRLLGSAAKGAVRDAALDAARAFF
jgi:hypothetical protein